MIQANELRIGNSIEAGEVEGIHFTERMIEVVKNKARSFIRMEFAEPIPLTPEILEKCGAYPLGGKYFLNVNELIAIKINLEHGYCELSAGEYTEGESATIDHIKTLHQLQNIYFSLTGEELEIKELENH